MKQLVKVMPSLIHGRLMTFRVGCLLRLIKPSMRGKILDHGMSERIPITVANAIGNTRAGDLSGLGSALKAGSCVDYS